MTAASIKAAKAPGYADYLESKTVAPEQGDYYLSPDGVPAEAAGRWIGDPDALQRVGISPGVVAPDELRALMEGRRPGDGEPVWLRNAGPDGTRAGGLDVTFSAPKGVSVAWALGDDRAGIEAAHQAAVDAALGYLRESTDLTVRYDAATTRSVPDTAAHLHAAAFTHTTARGVGPAVPDPQLHTHVVLTSVERADGSTGAVRSRPGFRAAREVGAFYRAQLAEELRGRGYGIEPAGEDGRYFRVRGISEEAERAFSKRTEEVEHAAREFRARTGREPERGELRDLAIKTRSRKELLPRDRGELDRTWQETGRRVGVGRETIEQAREHRAPAPGRGPDRDGWADRVEQAATAKRAIFNAAELRTAALEHAAGAGLAPRDALAEIDGLRREGRVLDLADGRMTTGLVREAEQEIDRRLHRMAHDRGAGIDPAAREHGIETVQARLGAPLSTEQRTAVETITGPGRASVLIGAAGTGKGVVIDAAAHAEQAAGRNVYGVAVAGRTAQRLGESAPALEGRTKTIDGFIASVESGRLHVDHQTTIYVDEAGMGDTARLAPLVAAVDERGGRLVAIGDHRQLPAIGAGGMFEHAAHQIPTAELAEVRRTQDPATREAWRELRDGDPAKAMAHYYARGQLHFAETRMDAVEAAARQYDRLARDLGHDRVALMSDASNVEIDTLNLRVQALRSERGELTPESVEHPDGHHLHGNDRIVWTKPMRLGDGGPRVENGERGTIATADPDKRRLTVQLDSGRAVHLDGEQLDSLRLAYAGHITREQGATVQHGIALTGGWQTSREGVYVQASRATDRTDFHISHDDLDHPQDAQRVQQLAAHVERSNAQTPSIAQPLHDPYRDPGEQHGRERVERYAPPRPPERLPAPAIDRAAEIAP